MEHAREADGAEHPGVEASRDSEGKEGKRKEDSGTPIKRALSRIGERWVFLGVAITGALLDLITKSLAFRALGANAREGFGGVDRTIIPGFLKLQAALNSGSLWGMFSGYSEVLTWISACIFALLVGMAFSSKGSSRGMQVALGLFCAGAIGNLADRLRFDQVRDFILFHVGDWRWPNFNLADTCICIGAVVFLWVEWRAGRDVRSRSDAPVVAGPSGEGDG
ncbi:MAG: signal peptidase II [Planctomycetota bacterium]|nr:signal peptidase II [Planctomycetota bacterium]